MTSALFCQTLNFSASPACLLAALQSVHHVVYLNNNGQLFIAFNAARYQIIQNDVVEVFDASAWNEYQVTTQPFHIELNNSQKDAEHVQHNAYVGFVAYDHAAAQQVDVTQNHQPALFIGYFQSFLRLRDSVWVFESSDPNAMTIFQQIQSLIAQIPAQNTFALTEKCTARWQQHDYADAFQKVQDYIVAGDCYQINLTQEFKAKAQGHLIESADAFWQLTNAPYAGYLRVGDFELLSCSPELFIDFEADRKIITKPIKGTMPRYADVALDEASKQRLIHSKKDQAENVMIVDLLRNDLSVYAETGSVKTPKLFNIESFNQVHHMVSEVEATLKTDVHSFDVLMSALPGGSITGAPKIRAMQIIEEIEGAPRGAYCGSMGYFNEDGTGSWNILIRSIQKYQEDVSLWAGGGITIASDCDAEYQECFDKVEAMLDLLNTWYEAE